MLTYDVPDAKRVRVILDTDAACEADDPFAIAYALMSPKLLVRTIVAEHFARPGSMALSLRAAERVTQAMGSGVPVLPGEEWPLDSAAPASEGVRALIQEARREDERPLFVLCLGALSNAARALRDAPDIAGRFTLVTIGGQPYDEPRAPWREFNFGNDVAAANAVLRSGADVRQIPLDVYGSVRVGLAELQAKVAPCGEIGRYLYEQMVAYNRTPEAAWTQGESWALGDSPAVAAALHPACGRMRRLRARTVGPDTAYLGAADGPEIAVYQSIDARYLLEDFFAKLRLMYGGGAACVSGENLL